MPKVDPNTGELMSDDPNQPDEDLRGGKRDDRAATDPQRTRLPGEKEAIGDPPR